MYLENWKQGMDWVDAEVKALVEERSAVYDKSAMSLYACRGLVGGLSQTKVKGTIDWFIPKLSLDTDTDIMTVSCSVALTNQQQSIEGIAQTAQYATPMDACKAALRKVLYRVLTMYALNENAVRLTQDVAAMLEVNDITDVTVEFAPGYTLFNLRDNHIGIGINPDILCNLRTIIGEDLYDVDSALSMGLLDSFSALPCVIEAMRRRTTFSTRLGFYTWKSAKTLLRAAYHTTVRVARNKVGYQSDGDCYALVDVRVCDERGIAEMKKEYGDDNVQVMPNENPRSTDYALARNAAELDMLKARYDKRPDCTYRIEDMGDNTYHLVYKQYICHAYTFSPTNLKTYERYGSKHSEEWAEELLGV